MVSGRAVGTDMKRKTGRRLISVSDGWCYFWISFVLDGKFL